MGDWPAITFSQSHCQDLFVIITLFVRVQRVSAGGRLLFLPGVCSTLSKTVGGKLGDPRRTLADDCFTVVDWLD